VKDADAEETGTGSQPDPINASGAYVSWLKEQLPRLVERGIIEEQTAEEIRSVYVPEDRNRWSGILLTTLGVLGALLVGGGCILLVAHNWSSFSKVTRLGISLLPVLIGLGLCFWTVYYRDGSVVWREGSAVFLSCGIAANIALIGQIYHISSGMDRYLLSVSLLVLPLVYLLRAHLPAMIYQAGIVSWLLVVVDHHDYVTTLWCWVLFAAVLPWLYRTLNARVTNTALGATQFLVSGIAVAFVVVGTMMPASEHFGLHLILVLSTLYVFIGTSCVDMPARYRTVLRRLGYTGLVVTVFAFTFHSASIWAWVHRTELYEGSWIVLADDVLVILSLVVGYASALVGSFSEPGQIQLKTVVVAPLVLLAGQGLFSATELVTIPFLLFNVYWLGFGVSMVTEGYRDRSLYTASLGTGMISLLFIVRFFDAELTFLQRGIGFVTVGVLFLIVTWRLSALIHRTSEGGDGGS
jgi:hypothetical protein